MTGNFVMACHDKNEIHDSMIFFFKTKQNQTKPNQKKKLYDDMVHYSTSY
jgi:hypothetical protein